MKPLQLSQAYATWVLDNNDNKWVVYDKDGEELGRFPSSWDAKDCMTAIRLGREYELIAFNRGIKFGKEKQLDTDKLIITELMNKLKFLEETNNRLSSKLEQFIIGDE